MSETELLTTPAHPPPKSAVSLFGHIFFLFVVQKYVKLDGLQTTNIYVSQF